MEDRPASLGFWDPQVQPVYVTGTCLWILADMTWDGGWDEAVLCSLMLGTGTQSFTPELKCECAHGL